MIKGILYKRQYPPHAVPSLDRCEVIGAVDLAVKPCSGARDHIYYLGKTYLVHDIIFGATINSDQHLYIFVEHVE